MTTPALVVRVDRVFAGKAAALAGDSRASAIHKQQAAGAQVLGDEGLASDEQADRRVHGGREKALHHLPAERYAQLAAAFPEAQNLFPGSLGENLSTMGVQEDDVCIGDVFALGTATIQLAQPRTPCWKIDARCGTEGVAAHVARGGLAGWYYRVLVPGTIAAGDELRLIERQPGAPSVARFWRIVGEHRPLPAALLRLAQTPGLNPDWVRKLHQRLDWLRDNG